MEIWSFWGGGFFGNFGFGLRRKSWKFGHFWGGYSLETSDLDLGEKVGNLDFWGGVGFFGNFGFGLRRKSWKFGHFGGGVLWKLRIWT